MAGPLLRDVAVVNEDKGAAAQDILVDEKQVEKTYNHKLDADDALAFVQAHGVKTITPEEDKRILHKVDRFLMPLVRHYPYLSRDSFRLDY